MVEPLSHAGLLLLKMAIHLGLGPSLVCLMFHTRLFVATLLTALGMFP